MFGGHGVFADGHIFALVYQEDVYLRACDSKIEEYKVNDFVCYTYTKSNKLHKSLTKIGGKGFETTHIVTTRYYKVPYTGEKLLNEAAVVLAGAIAEKAPAPMCEKRLKDLVNLKLSSERMLKRSGIDSYSKLKETGAVGAHLAVRSRVNENLDDEFVLRLQGAIDNVHFSTLSPELREDLLLKIQVRSR